MMIERTRRRYRGAVPWMAGNSVAANLLMLFFLIGGIIVAGNIRQEVFPEYETGIVSVSVTYPGASPEEVERGIILAVEEAVQGVDGVKEINSTASEGVGVVKVEVLEGSDSKVVAQDIESEVKAITSFPDEAETPVIKVENRRREVITHAVYGDVPQEVLREIAEDLRDTLIQDSGITQVELDGTSDYEIHIEVPQENLRRYGLTLKDIASRISSASVELPGGSIKARGGEIMVRMKERRDFAREYASIPIITPDDGSKILLEDIADIKEGFSDSKKYGTFNGKPAIIVGVYRVGDEKPIELAKAVRDKVDLFKNGLPEGVSISLVRDSSEVFEQRATLLIRNGYMGLILVFISLALFLDISLAFWVSMGIPVSVLGSFIFLSGTDFSINVVSMFAFIVTLGIVVDDAIVVGESIYSSRKRMEAEKSGIKDSGSNTGESADSLSYLDASIEGAEEVGVPVVFSILTNVVSFIPIMFVPGVMGKLFWVIPTVVISVFSVSLIESLFILPAHLSHRSRRKPGMVMGWLNRRQQYVSDLLVRSVVKIYGPFVRSAVRNRYITLALSLSLLLTIIGYVKSGRITTTLMPRVESDYSYVTATLPYGSSDEKIAEVLKHISDAAAKVIKENGGDKLSRGFYGTVEGNIIYSGIILTPPDVRPIPTTEVTDAWRVATGEIPGLESILFESDRGGPGSGAALTIELTHRNIETLREASIALAEALGSFPTTRDIDDGSARGKEQFDFRMKPQGQAMGLGARDLALQVRYAFYGAEAIKVQRGRNEVTVRIRLPENERNSEHNLETLIVHAPDGTEALLRSVVTMERGRAYTSIERREGRRIGTVSSNVVPRNETDRIMTVLREEILPELMQRFPGLNAQFEGRHADLRESTNSLISGLLMALLGIYALLAIPFKSYFQPMIIMSAIPFGIVGAILGHIMLGFPLSLMSLFGLVALSGVVVNDSLVMVDFANRKRRYEGAEPSDAIVQAGIQRFRPIMLTTLTTFGGLAPMIFETSRQARFMIPMAVSLGFGILFSTAITLALVPSLYMVIEDMLSLFRREESTEHQKTDISPSELQPD